MTRIDRFLPCNGNMHLKSGMVASTVLNAAWCPTRGHGERNKNEAFWSWKPGFAVQFLHYYAPVQDFLAKYLRKGYYIVTNIIQNVYFTFHNYISSISQAYLKLISDIHTSYPRYILGRSPVFLNRISSIHFKLILIISQANLNRISGLEPVSGLSRTSLRYISVIKPYLMHFWRISLLYILVSKPCFAVLVPTEKNNDVLCGLH